MGAEHAIRRMAAAYRHAERFASTQERDDKSRDWPAERERCYALAEALTALAPDPPEPDVDDAATD